MSSEKKLQSLEREVETLEDDPSATVKDAKRIKLRITSVQKQVTKQQVKVKEEKTTHSGEFEEVQLQFFFEPW